MKQLFISTVSAMVDHETIFMASADFWGRIFDRLETGVHDNIDRTFVAIYKTLKAVDRVQYSLEMQRMNESNTERRILLSAIEARLKGKNVIVIGRDQEHIQQLESEFFRLIDLVKPLLNNRHGNVDILTRGRISFISMISHKCEGFDWVQRRLKGMDKKDVLYIAPSLVNQHYAPILAEYKQNSREISVSDFVNSLEQAIEQIAAARKNDSRSMVELAIDSGAKVL